MDVVQAATSRKGTLTISCEEYGVLTQYSHVLGISSLERYWSLDYLSNNTTIYVPNREIDIVIMMEFVPFVNVVLLGH